MTWSFSYRRMLGIVLVDLNLHLEIGPRGTADSGSDRQGCPYTKAPSAASRSTTGLRQTLDKIVSGLQWQTQPGIYGGSGRPYYASPGCGSAVREHPLISLYF